MGTKASRTRTRLREIRDTDNPSIDDVVWNEQNRLCVVETITAPETSDERSAEIEQRRSHAETLVDELTPAAYAFHLALLVALRAHKPAIEARFAGDPPHLLVALRVPSDEWYIPAHKAFSAIVAGLVADRLAVPTKMVAASAEHDRAIGEYQLSSLSILRHVRNDHVVALYHHPDQMPGELRPFCDAVVDLSRIGRRHFDLAIGREFDAPDEPSWSDRISLVDLDPHLLDSVCSRAARASAVVPMMRAVLDARVAAKKRMEAEAAKTPAKTSSSKAAFVPEVLHPTEPTLDQLSGYGAFARWAKDAARDIDDYRGGRLAWSDVDVGCLLHGPPGTGKTFAARAFAATCGLPFMPVSFAQWTASGRSYQGDVIAAMRATFAAAAAVSPCVLFIDEFDSIPSREGTKEYRDYWIPIVNAGLELLDGTAGRPGVIVIAACNDPSRLDPAMVRSGRLDRHFRLSLPDEPSLLGMMGYHLPGADLNELAPAATVLAGSASAADVARIAREARRAARREERAVTARDFLAIAISADTLPVRDRRLVAVHEAGHAVAAMIAGRMPDALSIVTADGAHGGVRVTPDLGMGRLVDFENEVVARLSGRAAEEVLLGEPSAGAETDLQVATSLVVRILGTTGLGGRLTHGETLDGHAVEARMRDLYARALRLVGEHRAAVERLAELALERRVLGRAALLQFAAEHGFGGVR